MCFLIALSGASGVIYGIEAIKYILSFTEIELHCIISEAAKDILTQELHFTSLKEALGDLAKSPKLKIHSNKNFFSEVASGSFHFNAMIISLCSANTLSLLSSHYINADDGCCLNFG